MTRFRKQSPPWRSAGIRRFPDERRRRAISDFFQAIANTAGFHFATIEQGGTSLYPSLAQRVTSVEVLRIVLSIGGTEVMHFQTWQDKAGNAPPLTHVVDPVTGVKVTFPDLNSPPFGGERFPDQPDHA